MNPYSSGRYPLMHSLSSPTPTSQMGGTMGSMMDTNSGSGNMSRDQMLSGSTPLTPPPPPPGGGNNINTSVPNSMGMSTTSGNNHNNNMAYVNTSSNSSHNSTNISSSMNNRGAVSGSVTTNAAGGGGGGSGGGLNRDQIYSWIQDLSSPETRERALIELSKKREVLPDLAPMLWHSFGTIAALLQEIVMIYPVINPPTLNAQQSNRVCNALALLQCVASHPETRSTFLNAHIPLFLYPFLHTVSKSRPFEYLRLTSLGVVGALVKTDEQDVINFLLTTEIIPLCLRIMESGSELSKTVATFILQKILLDETGLSYICQTFERFSHVSNVLAKMVQQLGRDPSTRLLKHVVRCYLRLSDNLRAREALRACLPEQLKDTTFAVTLKDDSTTKKWLSQLMQNLGIDSQMVTVTTTTNSGGSGGGAVTAIATTSQ